MKEGKGSYSKVAENPQSVCYGYYNARGLQPADCGYHKNQTALINKISWGL